MESVNHPGKAEPIGRQQKTERKHLNSHSLHGFRERVFMYTGKKIGMKNKLMLALRMALGGAACGNFLGIFVGALIGAIYGGFVTNVAHGLDGALLGGGLGILGGSVFGAVLAFRESQENIPLQRIAGQTGEPRNNSTRPLWVHGPEWSPMAETRHFGV